MITYRTIQRGDRKAVLIWMNDVFVGQASFPSEEAWQGFKNTTLDNTDTFKRLNRVESRLVRLLDQCWDSNERCKFCGTLQQGLHEEGCLAGELESIADAVSLTALAIHRIAEED